MRCEVLKLRGVDDKIRGEKQTRESASSWGLTRFLSGIELWSETDNMEVATGNWNLETRCRVETSLSQVKG